MYIISNYLVPKDIKEGLLWYLYITYLLHPLFTFLLMTQFFV